MVRAPALAAASWELEGRLGGAWNAGLPIVIQQQGYENLRFTAELRTRGLDPPLYYGGRITAWQSGRGWAIDLVHHKLHLEEPPPEVRSFAISHGYNLLTLQRLFARHRWRYGAGLGAVVAHPESEVRGLVFEETQGLFRDGYYVAGVTAAGSPDTRSRLGVDSWSRRRHASHGRRRACRSRRVQPGCPTWRCTEPWA